LRVTVSVITYPGGEKYLQETIDSINDQTFKDFKLVVTNDDRNNTIKWNEAIDQCDTEYLWLFHHDDVALPNFLETMVAALDAQPTAAAAFCHDYIIDQNGKRVGQTECRIPQKPLYTYRDLVEYSGAFGNVIRCPSFTLRMSMFKDDQDLRHCLDPARFGTAGDTALWYRITSKHPIIILPDKLYKYRTHPDSDTQKNIVGTAAVWDGMRAWAYGVTLRPEDVRWRTWMGLESGQVKEKLWREGVRLQGRSKASQRVRFVVVHEPPYNAGTGVLAAERVKLLNQKDNSWFTFYVCPGEKHWVGMQGDIPVITCDPKEYRALVANHKPSFIEFWHFLVWPLEFLGVDVPKSLWLHDATLWCPKFHMWDGQGICTNAGVDKCAKCVGVKASDIEARKDYIASVLPKFDQLISNSEWTAEGLSREYGLASDISEPKVPPLTLHPARKRIGFFGGFYPVKGVNVLLDAMKRLPDVDLMMFSNGVPPEMLDGHRLWGYGNVWVVGGYARSDMAFLGHLVDLCVVPSLIESYGLVARELRSLGFNVVCSTAGGLGEIGTFEPDNVDALVEAIKEAI
jgi:glycosyltransferase involved in cell wall biosynthesis